MANRISLSVLWALSILGVWIVVSQLLGQSLLAPQHSKALVAFGAIKGSSFTFAESWRLLVSQWLHVKFPHMLLNVLVIALVGRAAEARVGGWLAPLVGVVGGTIGQFAIVCLEPLAFISGASQAYMALCGLTLVMARVRSLGWGAALVATLVGIGLDVFVSGHGLPKVGHLVGLGVGFAAGIGLNLCSGHTRINV